MAKDNSTTFKSLGNQVDAGLCGPDGCDINAHRKLMNEDKKVEEKNND